MNQKWIENELKMNSTWDEMVKRSREKDRFLEGKYEPRRFRGRFQESAGEGAARVVRCAQGQCLSRVFHSTGCGEMYCSEDWNSWEDCVIISNSCIFFNFFWLNFFFYLFSTFLKSLISSLWGLSRESLWAWPQLAVRGALESGGAFAALQIPRLGARRHSAAGGAGLCLSHQQGQGLGRRSWCDAEAHGRAHLLLSRPQVQKWRLFLIRLEIISFLFISFIDFFLHLFLFTFSSFFPFSFFSFTFSWDLKLWDLFPGHAPFRDAQGPLALALGSLPKVSGACGPCERCRILRPRPLFCNVLHHFWLLFELFSSFFSFDFLKRFQEFLSALRHFKAHTDGLVNEAAALLKAALEPHAPAEAGRTTCRCLHLRDLSLPIWNLKFKLLNINRI